MPSKGKEEKCLAVFAEISYTRNIRRWEIVPTNEKEINNYLFDQLTLLERIERQVNKGDLKAVQEEIEILKKEVNRKLYQQPPLVNEAAEKNH